MKIFEKDWVEKVIYSKTRMAFDSLISKDILTLFYDEDPKEILKITLEQIDKVFEEYKEAIKNES